MKKQTTMRRNNTNKKAANTNGTIIAKIAGISTAAVLAVSVPVMLHSVKSGSSTAENTAPASQKNEITNMNADKNEVKDSVFTKAEDSSSEAPAAEAVSAEFAEAESVAEASSAAESVQADSSSQAEVKKSVRETNLDAINGSHMFTVHDHEISFGELYSKGCANASNSTDGLAMALIGEHGGMNKVYHTVFYTTDNGNEWKQLDYYPTIVIDDLQYFALDNGDILVFRYGGALPAPTINIFTQSAEDPEPYVSGERFILDGKVLDDGYTISSEYAPYEFKASYSGGNILHIDVTNDSDVNVGSFDVDIYDHTTSAAETESTDTKTETAPVDMTVDKLLSTDVDTLLAMSDNDYEFVQVEGQCEYYGFKCAAFPNYIFRVDQDYEDGKANGPFQVPANIDPENMHMEIYGKEIKQIDLHKGAYIGNGVTVGMTYNEIKEAMGGELKVQVNNSSMMFSADVEIDGRVWMLHFDLTDEQMDDVYSRICAEQPDPDNIDHFLLWETTVDISDINPVCDIAVWF